MTDPTERPVVIVTGSSGYVGSAVVKRLAADYRVVGFDRHTPPHPPAEAECVCFDITDASSIEAAFSRVRIAYGDKIASVSIWRRTSTSRASRTRLTTRMAYPFASGAIRML